MSLNQAATRPKTADRPRRQPVGIDNRKVGGMEMLAARAAKETAGLLDAIGRNIRALRIANHMTLKDLAERTELSPSMLSLLERGRTAPSIGTMVVVASALDVQMSDLLHNRLAQENEPVSRAVDQPVFKTLEGASRRILKRDRKRGIEIALNEYPSGAASATEPRGHDGFEFGIAIEGKIEVTIDGRTYALEAGDVISYPSSQPHRIANPGRKPARALWLNLRNA